VSGLCGVRSTDIGATDALSQWAEGLIFVIGPVGAGLRPARTRLSLRDQWLCTSFSVSVQACQCKPARLYRKALVRRCQEGIDLMDDAIRRLDVLRQEIRSAVQQDIRAILHDADNCAIDG
jgi:hypothetical protein